MRSNRFIYILKDGRNGEPFYVGSGTYSDRPNQHIDIALNRSDFRRNKEQEAMYEFIREIIDSGNEVLIDTPYTDVCYNEAMELEEMLTRKIGTKYDGNGPLYNIKYGNKFPDGFRSGENNSFYGKKHTTETLEKLRNPRSRGWTCSEETKRKRSQNHRGPTSVVLYDVNMKEIATFSQIKLCAEYLRELHPELPFSNSMVNTYSKSENLMNNLYYIKRIKG